MSPTDRRGGVLDLLDEVVLVICPTCKTDFNAGSPAEAARRKHCSKRCAAKARGVNPTTTRYASVKRDGRRQAEHRWLVEQYIGRKLRADEYVHHRNGIKTDNRIENLEVIDPVAHGREHHLRKPLTGSCVACGAEFTPHKTKRGRQKSCGRQECRRAAIGIGRRSSPSRPPSASSSAGSDSLEAE